MEQSRALLRWRRCFELSPLPRSATTRVNVQLRVRRGLLTLGVVKAGSGSPELSGQLPVINFDSEPVSNKDLMSVRCRVHCVYCNCYKIHVLWVWYLL